MELESFELGFYRRQPDDGEDSSNEEDAAEDLDKDENAYVVEGYDDTEIGPPKNGNIDQSLC